MKTIQNQAHDQRIGFGPQLLELFRRQPALLIILAGVVLFAFVSDRFFTVRNLQNIGNQASFLLVIALGQTIVLIGRGFDLSMGNAVSLISVAIALVMTNSAESGATGAKLVVLGVVTALAIGIAIGVIIGTLSGLVGMNSFIVSLGMMQVCYGFASIISGGRPVFNVPLEFITAFNSGTILSIPAPIIISAVICLLVHWVLSRTVYGRLLYMVGSNPRAAYVAGHSPRRVMAVSFVIAGGLVALSALLLTARTGTGEPNLGANLLLQAIAAAAIGGVSLAGGRGTVWHAFFGTLTITVLSNVLNLLQVSGYIQTIALGAIIILALWLERRGTQ